MKPHHHKPKRVKSHVSLHVSKHSVLGGDGVAVRGKVRPGGRHRVKVVVSGPDRQTIALVTKSNGTFRVRWARDRIGNYEVQAFGVHDRRARATARSVA